MADAKREMTGKAGAKMEAARSMMREGTAVTPEQVHCALRVIEEFIQEEHSRHGDERLEKPKVSLAWLSGESWVCSVVWWPRRLQVNGFSHCMGRAIYKLAERLCEGGDLWRPMKDKA